MRYGAAIAPLCDLFRLCRFGRQDNNAWECRHLHAIQMPVRSGWCWCASTVSCVRCLNIRQQLGQCSADKCVFGGMWSVECGRGKHVWRFAGSQSAMLAVCRSVAGLCVSTASTDAPVVLAAVRTAAAEVCPCAAASTERLVITGHVANTESVRWRSISCLSARSVCWCGTWQRSFCTATVFVLLVRSARQRRHGFLADQIGSLSSVSSVFLVYGVRTSANYSASFQLSNALSAERHVVRGTIAGASRAPRWQCGRCVGRGRGWA